MHYAVVDHLRWPVADPEDFQTRDGEVFPLFEDEDGSRVYGYGHIPAPEFLAEVRRYCLHMNGGDPDAWPVDDGLPVIHVYAKFKDIDGERFSWASVTAATPHAFPMTVLDW